MDKNKSNNSINDAVSSFLSSLNVNNDKTKKKKKDNKKKNTEVKQQSLNVEEENCQVKQSDSINPIDPKVNVAIFFKCIFKPVMKNNGQN